MAFPGLLSCQSEAGLMLVSSSGLDLGQILPFSPTTLQNKMVGAYALTCCSLHPEVTAPPTRTLT